MNKKTDRDLVIEPPKCKDHLGIGDYAPLW